MDVLDMLKKDHQTVTKLFQRFKGATGRSRTSVVEKLCDELDTHARLEEQLFYPAVEEAGDSELKRLVGEARQEHERAKQQVRMLRAAIAEGGDGLDTQVSALEQDVEHHVAEEEGEMFPRVEEIMDASERADMARRAQARRREIQRELGGGAPAAAAGGRTRRAARRPGKAKGAAKRGQARAQSSLRKRAKSAKTSKASRSRRTSGRKRARGGGGR